MIGRNRGVRYGAAVAIAAAVAGVAFGLPGNAGASGASPSASSSAVSSDLVNGAGSDGHRGHDHHPQNSGDIVFGPAPAVFPPGAEMAVLQGDPSAAGSIFTVRLRLPNGYVIPPHTHPTDEHVTVISGTFLVGLGDTFDRHTLLPPLHAGGFVTAPAGVSHFAIAKGRTIVQVHAIGPFQLDYVNPADDPRGRT